MINWIQNYWQLLFVGTISYIGGLAAPVLVKIIDEALTEIMIFLKKFHVEIKLKFKIIQYNLLIKHLFTEDEYNIYKKLKDKKTLTKKEKNILNYMESNDEIFINIIIREINNKPINHDYQNYSTLIKYD